MGDSHHCDVLGKGHVNDSARDRPQFLSDTLFLRGGKSESKKNGDSPSFHVGTKKKSRLGTATGEGEVFLGTRTISTLVGIRG